MSGPLLQDGAIALRGERIIAVGPRNELSPRQGYDQRIDYGEALITPGLVNAHVHLELSDRTAGTPPTGLADWLIGVIASTPPPSPKSDATIAAATRAGAAECIRCGVTTAGDITAWPAITRAAFAESPLKVVSYGEVRAMAARRALLEPRIASAISPAHSPNVHTGISPHSPYSVEPQGYGRCLGVARANRLPLATHLAESADESEFLASHSGPLRRVWDFLQAWDGNVPNWAAGPIRLAEGLGLLAYPTLLAHVNYCNDAEMQALSRGRASVVYCPRTHAFFGHPPHRWREMLDRGINVALGTDSRASSPDLNLLDDLRLVRRIAPDVNTSLLWEMVTKRAAMALTMESDIGTLEPGKSGDLAVFETQGDRPLDFVLDNPVRPAAVWCGGIRVEP